MNPAFELDQIHRYIDHLAADPKQLSETVDSHFFPVLQRIFFREGFEVQKECHAIGRRFNFLLKDLDLKHPNVAVNFSYTRESKSTALPGFAAKWDEGTDDDRWMGQSAEPCKLARPRVPPDTRR